MVRRARHGVDAGRAEISHRLVPYLALAEVKPQGEGVARGIRRCERLERLARAPVEQLAPRRQEPIVDDRLEPVVNEVEAFPDALQHATPDQLLDPFRRRRFVQATGAVEERELKLTSDHRRHGRELSRRLASRSRRAAIIARTRSASGRPVDSEGIAPSWSARMVSTATKGLPSLTAQT